MHSLDHMLNEKCMKNSRILSCITSLRKPHVTILLKKRSVRQMKCNTKQDVSLQRQKKKTNHVKHRHSYCKIYTSTAAQYSGWFHVIPSLKLGSVTHIITNHGSLRPLHGTRARSPMHLELQSLKGSDCGLEIHQAFDNSC